MREAELLYSASGEVKALADSGELKALQDRCNSLSEASQSQYVTTMDRLKRLATRHNPTEAKLLAMQKENAMATPTENERARRTEIPSANAMARGWVPSLVSASVPSSGSMSDATMYERWAMPTATKMDSR